jgi:transposase-like protein
MGSSTISYPCNESVRLGVLSKHGTAAARARVLGRSINASTPGNIRRAKNKRVLIALVEAFPASNVFARGCDDTRRGASRIIVASCYTENLGNVAELVRQYVEPGSIIFTDESIAYTRLSEKHEHYSVNHSEGYCSPDGFTDNLAEGFFSRVRRAEHTHHGFRPLYFELYAWEMAWREMCRRETQEDNVRQLLEWMLSPGYSHFWRRYHGGEKRRTRRCVRRETVMPRPN